MTNSTTNGRQSKPGKPYEGFSLFAHDNGQWVKKIRGRFHYFGFGPWADPDGALRKYLDERDDLHARRAPDSAGRPDGGGPVQQVHDQPPA